MTLSMLICMLPTAYAVQSEFTDMPEEGYWSHDALQAAVDNGLMQGNGGRLNPRRGLLTITLAHYDTPDPCADGGYDQPRFWRNRTG